MRSFLRSLGLVCFLMGCMPSFLEKYQKPQALEPEKVAKTEQQPKKLEAASPPPSQFETRFQQVAKQKFRYDASYDKVWSSALKVLIGHYNINIIDRKSGVITTEWDSFYLDRGVFRNKVSLLLEPSDHGKVEVRVYNNIEYLSEKDNKALWLPAPDDYQESGRIAREISRDLHL